MKPYLSLIYAFIVIGLVTVIWFSGVNHGKNLSDAACNVERLAVARATNDELAKHQRQAEQWAIQLTAANDARDLALARLARLNSTPHPHILCHAAPASGSGPVPGVPAASSNGATVIGELPVQPDFDPTTALYSEARRADEIVEACRFIYNQWPQS